jgi:nucleolar protein 16
MARPRKRRTTRNPSQKVKRVAKHKMDISMNKAHPLVQKNWDRKLTLLQNYEKLGLISSLGGKAGGTEKEGELRVREQEYRDQLIQNVEYRALDQEIEFIETIEKPVVVDERAKRLGLKVNVKKLLDTKPLPKTDVVKELEKEAAEYRPVLQHQSEQETLVFEKLFEKYGLEFDKMARDIELNVYQLSAGQLKRKMKKCLLV